MLQLIMEGQVNRKPKNILFNVGNSKLRFLSDMPNYLIILSKSTPHLELSEGRVQLIMV